MVLLESLLQSASRPVAFKSARAAIRAPQAQDCSGLSGQLMAPTVPSASTLCGENSGIHGLLAAALYSAAVFSGGVLCCKAACLMHVDAGRLLYDGCAFADTSHSNHCCQARRLFRDMHSDCVSPLSREVSFQLSGTTSAERSMCGKRQHASCELAKEQQSSRNVGSALLRLGSGTALL